MTSLDLLQLAFLGQMSLQQDAAAVLVVPIGSL
jgi:hypothetical protein